VALSYANQLPRRRFWADWTGAMSFGRPPCAIAHMLLYRT
jgi:hypothetical protein